MAVEWVWSGGNFGFARWECVGVVYSQRDASRTMEPKATMSVAVEINAGPTEADQMT